MAIAQIQSSRFFGVRMFGKKLPFSQGFAVRAILGMIGGKLVESGQVTSGAPEFGCYLYVKSIRGNRVAESIWFDDGVESASCKFVNLGDGWQEKIDGNWIPIEGMIVENLGFFVG